MPTNEGADFHAETGGKKKWEKFIVKRHFQVENQRSTGEKEEFIGKSMLLRGGRTFDSLSVYSPLTGGSKKFPDIKRLNQN